MWYTPSWPSCTGPNASMMTPALSKRTTTKPMFAIPAIDVPPSEPPDGRGGLGAFLERMELALARRSAAYELS